MRKPAPIVSIGVPVYNGQETLKCMLDSLTGQSFTDFELIISDNGSIDRTAAICEEYASKDQRIRYVCQSANIGAALNFKFVLDQARAPYFMWAACDDVRSTDFLEENIRFLEAHPDYVASTSPNCFEGREPAGANLVTFSITGNVEERFRKFFDHCWASHGIFYSVIRTDVLRGCDLLGQSFIAADWAIDLYIASRGNIHRTDKGLTVFGLGGISSRAGSYRAFRNRRIELLFPFYRLSCNVLKLSRGFRFSQRVALMKTLLKLNMKAGFDQFYSALYQFYCTHLKPDAAAPPSNEV